MKLPSIWTAIATRTDCGHDWTPLPRAIFSLKEARELVLLGHAETMDSRGGIRLRVLSVRAARS